jgi:hypothetical protein
MSDKKLRFRCCSFSCDPETVTERVERHYFCERNAEIFVRTGKVYMLIGDDNPPRVYMNPLGSINRAAFKSSNMVIYPLHYSDADTARSADILPPCFVFEVFRSVCSPFCRLSDRDRFPSNDIRLGITPFKTSRIVADFTTRTHAPVASRPDRERESASFRPINRCSASSLRIPPWREWSTASDHALTDKVYCSFSKINDRLAISVIRLATSSTKVDAVGIFKIRSSISCLPFSCFRTHSECLL